MRSPNPPPQNDEGDLRLYNSSELEEQPLAEELEIGKCLRLIKYLGFDIFCRILYFFFKKPQISKATSQNFECSFHGDTVSVTSFIDPILRLLPFGLPPLLHLWVPASANQPNTHCHSFFPHQIDGAPSRLISPIGQPVWAFVPDI